MKESEKKLIQKRIKEAKFSRKFCMTWAVIWFVLGLLTIIMGGFLLWIPAYISLKKAKAYKREYEDLEVKL